MKNLFTAILIGTSLFAFCLHAAAQQNLSAASFGGVVYDSNGLVIQGAEVLLLNDTNNRTYVVTTDTRGRFNFSYVPVGTYSLTARATGFRPVTTTITFGVGQVMEMPMYLGVGEIAASVDVRSFEPGIESSRTQAAEIVTEKEVADLPLNGRNYLDLALLVPGVSRTNLGRNQRFAETSATSGTGISVSGQRNLNNSFLVDGTSANDDAASLSGTVYSQEIVREFQVITSGGSAEFGRASSGVVNILTKSGTNYFHGNVFGFLRDDRFDARNPLGIEKNQLTQTQYGGNIGGPLVRDRTFFFTNVEVWQRNDSSIITIDPSDAEAINLRLDQVNYRGRRVLTGQVPSSHDAINFFGKVDHTFDQRNTLALSYSLYDTEAENSRTVGGLNSESRGSGIDNTDHTIGVQFVSTLGARSVNELRGLYRRSRFAAPVNDNNVPAVNIAGVADFGPATFSPTARALDLVQITDSFSASFRDHTVKVGGEVLYNHVDISFPGAIHGVYSFSGLDSFLGGNYSQYQQAFGPPDQEQHNPNPGVFAQDEWRLRKNLTLNLGIRYDIQYLSDPIQTDDNNIAPRFGFAYAFGKRSVIRGGFGLYFDRIPLRATSNALQRDGSRYFTAVILQNADVAPTFPQTLDQPPGVLQTRPSVTRIDPEIETGFAHQGHLQFEHELPFDSRLSVGYQYLRGLHLILSRNVNVPTCTDASLNLCRPDPSFGNISRYEGSGESSHHGLQVAFSSKAGSWLRTRISYNFSRSIDNVGNFFFSSPQDNFDLRGDKGLSDNDQRHRLTISGLIAFPRDRAGSLLSRLYRGFSLSYLYSYASALPFNVLAGSDLNRDTNNNDRPFGLGRNTGRGFDFSSLDLRAARTISFNERFALNLFVEGFNLLNRSNLTVPNNTYGTGTAPRSGFGRPTAALDSRQMQFGLRFSF